MSQAIKILSVSIMIALLFIGNPVIAQTWTFTNGPYRPHEVKDITSSKVGSVQTIYAADVETLKVTTDGGTSWSNTGSLMLNPLVVASHPTDASIVHVGKLVGLWKSVDGGGTWVNKISDNNFVPLRLAVSTNNPNYWLLGADTVLRNSNWTTSVYRTQNGGISWDPVNYFRDNAHTNANDAVYHPLSNQVWVGGSKNPLSQTPDNSGDGSPVTKGVWYSSNGGTNWSFQPGTGQNLLGGGSTHRNVSALAYSYNASDDHLLFAAVTWLDGTTVKAKLYQSGDDGSNWSLTADLYAQIGVSQVRAMKVKPTNYNVIVAATDRGFAISTNRGSAWTLPQQPTDLQTAYQAMFDKLDPNVNKVWLGAYPTLYVTPDLGTSWSENEGIYNFMNTAGFTVNGTTSHGVMNNYTGVARYSSGVWDKTPKILGNRQFSAYDVAINFNTTSKAYAVGDEAGLSVIYRRTDGGDGWTKVFTSETGSYSTPLYTIEPDLYSGSQLVSAGGAFRVYGAYFNFLRSLDDGSTWSWMRKIGSWDGVPVLALAYNYVFGVGYTSLIYAGLGSDGSSGKGVWKSTDGGDGWVSYLNNKIVQSIALNPPASSTTIYFGTTLSSPNAVYKSTNGLTSEPTSVNAPFNGAKRMLMHPSYPNDANHLWVITGDGQKIYKTANGGSNWTEINTTGIASAKPLNDLQRDPQNNQLIYVAAAQGVYKVDPEPEAPTGVDVSGSSGQHPHISWNASSEVDLPPTNKYKVYRYMQDCWYDGPKIICGNPGPASDLTPTPISNTYFDDNSLTITDPCPLECLEFDKATYYTKVIDNANNYSVASLSDYVYVGGGPNPGKTAIREDISEGQIVPVKFDLYANYPNPFNPITQIKYALPEDINVVLKIYDVLGREVATLVNGHQSAGYKEASFNASHLPSGMYFYKINAGKFSGVKKMMLLK